MIARWSSGYEVVESFALRGGGGIVSKAMQGPHPYIFKVGSSIKGVGS